MERPVESNHTKRPRNEGVDDLQCPRVMSLVRNREGSNEGEVDKERNEGQGREKRLEQVGYRNVWLIYTYLRLKHSNRRGVAEVTYKLFVEFYLCIFRLEVLVMGPGIKRKRKSKEIQSFSEGVVCLTNLVLRPITRGNLSKQFTRRFQDSGRKVIEVMNVEKSGVEN